MLLWLPCFNPIQIPSSTGPVEVSVMLTVKYKSTFLLTNILKNLTSIKLIELIIHITCFHGSPPICDCACVPIINHRNMYYMYGVIPGWATHGKWVCGEDPAKTWSNYLQAKG